MKVVIAGASGFIGRALALRLQEGGHQVFKLVRKSPVNQNEIFWDPENNQLDPNAFKNCQAVVNLSGENIFGRWTEAKKKRIIESRLKATALLVNITNALENPPKVFVNASATSFLGARNDEVAYQVSTPPSGFLAEVCRQWEQAAEPLHHSKTRLIFLRFGAVLSSRGGALKNMLLPFKLGLGGRLGSGDQWMIWIEMEDAVSAIIFLIENDKCEGAYNVVSPNPVTNAEFTQTLGKLLHRPTLFTVPTFAVRLIFGELADELLLYGAAIKPKKLLDAGFQFQYPLLEKALNNNLTS